MAKTMPKIRGAAVALLALLATLTFSGCGPGVGGTGTGMEPPPGTAQPIALAALCDSDLAPLLRCPTTAAAALGTQLVWLADSTPTRNVQARVEGNAIDLELGCQSLVFTGTWGAAAPQTTARFFGQARNLVTGDAVAATLSAVREGGVLVVQVTDSLGRVLSPPIALQVRAGPAALGNCR